MNRIMTIAKRADRVINDIHNRVNGANTHTHIPYTHAHIHAPRVTADDNYSVRVLFCVMQTYL